MTLIRDKDGNISWRAADDIQAEDDRRRLSIDSKRYFAVTLIMVQMIDRLNDTFADELSEDIREEIQDWITALHTALNSY